MAGVPMPARDPEAEKRDAERASLHDVMELAATAFSRRQLQIGGRRASRAPICATAACRRPRSRRSASGYAPDSRNALKEHLAGKGVAKEQIEACGLVVFGPDIPVSYDRFRNRVMFPIEDARGRVIAFGGRALSLRRSGEISQLARDRALPQGARPLQFGAGAQGTCRTGRGQDRAAAGRRRRLHGRDRARAGGFASVVAPLGTALTEDQLAASVADGAGADPLF